MRIRFTERQLRELEKALRDPLHTYFLERPREHDGKMIEVDMIADAWLDIEDTLMLRWEHRKMTPALSAAASRIVREVRRHANHPAFHGQSVEGAQHEILFGWSQNGGGVSPFVTNWGQLGEGLVALMPHRSYAGRVMVTSWQGEWAPVERAVSWIKYNEMVRRST